MNIRKPKIIDNLGNITLLEVNKDRMESQKTTGNNITEIKNAPEAASLFLRVLQKSKFIKYQVDIDSYIEIAGDSTISEIIQKLIDISETDRTLLQNEQFFKISLNNFKSIVINIILQNNKYSDDFINYFYENQNIIKNDILLSVVRNTLPDILDKINTKISNRYDVSLYNSLLGLESERKNYYYDYSYLKKIVELSNLLNNEMIRVREYYFRNISLNIIYQEILFGNYTQLSEDKEFLKVIIESIVLNSVVNLEDMKKLTNKAFLHIFTLCQAREDRSFTLNPIFYLELYRRKLEKDISTVSLATLKAFFFENLIGLPTWPYAYSDEIKLILKDIFVDMNFSEFERVFFYIQKYEEIFSKEQIYKYLFEDNFELIINDKLLGNKSREYFKEIVKTKTLYKDNFRYREIFSDRHSYLLKDDITDSIYLKMAMAINIMKKDSTYNDSLISEVFRELFKALIPATKSEREKITEMISYLIHHDKYENNFDNINKNKIRIMFEEMSKSNLKNVTIERMIDKKDYYKTWEYSRGSKQRKMFGMDYTEVVKIIEGLELRNLFISTILKLQLN